MRMVKKNSIVHPKHIKKLSYYVTKHPSKKPTDELTSFWETYSENIFSLRKFSLPRKIHKKIQ